MNRKGVLFTLAMALVGAEILALSVVFLDYNTTGVSLDSMPSERVYEQYTAFEDAIAAIAWNASNINIIPGNDTLTLTQALPNDLSVMSVRLSNLRSIITANFNATVDYSDFQTSFASEIRPFGNYKMLSERKVLLNLSSEPAEIRLDMNIIRNISTCNLTKDPGDATRFTVTLEGNPGQCSSNTMINASGGTAYTINSGGIKIDINNNVMSIENNYPETMHVSIWVKFNTTDPRIRKVIIPGNVITVYDREFNMTKRGEARIR